MHKPQTLGLLLMPNFTYKQGTLWMTEKTVFEIFKSLSALYLWMRWHCLFNGNIHCRATFTAELYNCRATLTAEQPLPMSYIVWCTSMSLALSIRIWSCHFVNAASMSSSLSIHIWNNWSRPFRSSQATQAAWVSFCSSSCISWQKRTNRATLILYSSVLLVVSDCKYIFAKLRVGSSCMFATTNFCYIKLHQTTWAKINTDSLHGGCSCLMLNRDVTGVNMDRKWSLLFDKTTRTGITKV